MKKKILILGLAIAVVMGGCGKQSEETPAEDNPTEITEDKNKEDKIEKGEVVGSINSFTGSMLSITDEMGETYDLDVREAQFDCPQGILAGEQIRVSYEGNLKEEVKVCKVSNPEAQQKIEKATVTGMVEDISNNTLTIETADADSVTLITIGAEFACKGGLGIGTPVQITYLGEIRNGSSRNVKVLSVTDWEEGETSATESLTPEQTQTPEVTGEAKDIVADILTVDGEIMTVVTKENEEYKFSLANAGIELKYGLLQGSEIRITYRGEVNGGELVTEKIADVDPKVVNEETGGFTVVGTVMSWGNYVMTIMSNDGVQITCTTAGAVMESKEHPEETDYVKIIIKPSKKTNIYQALNVEYM